MLFWCIMLFFDLLIPGTMIGIGSYYKKKAPAEINAFVGYRTRLSMQNRETWEYAHHFFGRLWQISGLILLPLTVLGMLLLWGAERETVSWWGGGYCLIQLLVMVGCIFPTEVALHRKFNRDGNLK